MSDWFEQLYSANYDLIYRLATRRMIEYTGQSADVQDIVQEVFLLAYQKRHTLTAHPNQSGWLIKATMNSCENYRRKYYRTSAKNTVLPEEDKNNISSTADILSASKADDIPAADVRVAIQQSLPSKDQNLLQSYCIDQRPISQIAKENKTSESAIRVRIHRIRNEIIDILSRLM